MKETDVQWGWADDAVYKISAIVIYLGFPIGVVAMDKYFCYGRHCTNVY